MKHFNSFVLSIATILVCTFTLLSCGKDDSEDVIPTITSIAIREGSSLSLQIGTSQQLHVDYSPSSLPQPTVTWKSSDNSIVNIEAANGMITANKVGTATITASYENKLTATCTITVTPIPIKTITIDITSKKAIVGEKFTIAANYEPKDATSPTLVWNTSNKEVATVSNGNVTCVGEGTCQIIVEDESHAAKAVCDLIVEAIKVESITLDCSEKTITIGESFTIDATVLPDNATNKQITWSSSDETIAVVNEGSVTAVSVGTCTITATDKTKNIKAQCSITVKAFEPEAIDLGLTSGTLWSNVNVGATSPEQYGGYYAWGEIVEKETYSWSNYKFHVEDDYWMSKYSMNFNADFKSTLEPVDDVATKLFGEKWAIPTYEQFSELTKECKQEETEQNGIKGFLFTGPNGNKIFLPYAGRKEKKIEEEGATLYYWTSSLWMPAGKAQTVTGSGYRVSPSNMYRYYGCSIRPVAKK